ncbi:MAG: shikimate kinase [Cyanobacteria bacterium J055]|nr:MAG: shikimate kinase [Cyanobacteria bacterium J055]
MNDLLKGVNLYLVGMMGAGKSTIGQLLATELGYRFFDTDTLIEQVAQQSITEIFDRDGEEAFRQLESQVLGELSRYHHCVVATRGGIVTRSMNWSYLQHGIVLWLDVPVAQLHRRLQDDLTRPLLRDPDPQAKLQTLLDRRHSLYAQADVRLPVGEGETPEDLVPRAIEEIRKVLRSPTVDQN